MRHQLSNPATKQQLHQVSVETKNGPLAVGPAMIKEACEAFAGTIAAQIKSGAEKDWRNPQVLPVIKLEH